MTKAAVAAVLAASVGVSSAAGAPIDSTNAVNHSTAAVVSADAAVAPAVQTDPTQLSGPIERYPGAVMIAIEQLRLSLRGGAAAAILLPGDGTDFDSWTFAYHTNEPRQMNILEAPKDGVVRASIIVNASGHSGDLMEFARTNTYTVRVELPDGRVLRRSGIPRNVVSDPTRAENTPEMVTLIDIEFPYQTDGITKVTAYPDGSGGRSGYIEGRLYEVHPHTAPWDPVPQILKAIEYMRAHPEIPWGTSLESAAREANDVAPAPYPIGSYAWR